MKELVTALMRNPTTTDSHYRWLKTGLYLKAGETKALSFDPYSLCDDPGKQLLDADLASGRIEMTLVINPRLGVKGMIGEFVEPVIPPKPRIKAVEAPKAPEQAPTQPETSKGQEAPVPAKSRGKLKAHSKQDSRPAVDPVQHHSDTFKDQTMDQMKPKAQPMFGEKWNTPTRRDVPETSIIDPKAFGGNK